MTNLSEENEACRPGYWYKKTSLKKLTPAQRLLLARIAEKRRWEISQEIEKWGLRNAVSLHKHPSLATAGCLGLKRVDPRSLAALEKAGFISLSARKSHTVHRYVNPFTREVCFKDHYETTYFARLTSRGSRVTK